jgi:hypothetical protein
MSQALKESQHLQTKNLDKSLMIIFSDFLGSMKNMMQYSNNINYQMQNSYSSLFRMMKILPENLQKKDLNLSVMMGMNINNSKIGQSNKCLDLIDDSLLQIFNEFEKLRDTRVSSWQSDSENNFKSDDSCTKSRLSFLKRKKLGLAKKNKRILKNMKGEKVKSEENTENTYYRELKFFKLPKRDIGKF